MTTAAIRERLHDFIRDADDKKVEALYLILEDQVAQPYEWSKDAEFVAELDERYRQYEEGIDKGISLEELEASIELRNNQSGGI